MPPMKLENNETLLRCPFCGNQPSISEAGHWAEVVISCNCHASSQVVQRCVAVDNGDGRTFHYDNERAKKEAIELWNKRAEASNTNNPKVADEGKSCKHDTLHFEGKRLAWLVCSCGKRWERCVEYTKSIRSTRFRHTKKERYDV